MDVRGKLVDIVCDATQINGCIHSCNHPPCAMVRGIVDALIENGVTVQEWISVDDRLPEESGLYITFGCTAVPVRWLHNFDKDIRKFGAWWNYEPDGKEHIRYRFIEAENITHWMPLPEPPKGE